MPLTGMLVGFDFAQPTLLWDIIGFGDLLMLIERAMQFNVAASPTLPDDCGGHSKPLL